MAEVLMILRHFETPCSEEELRAKIAESDSFGVGPGAEHVVSYLAADGLSALLVLRASDLDAALPRNAEGGESADTIWRASEHLGEGISSVLDET